VSNEVDLAIIDEMYTPYIFRYGKLKFVPIEAVAAVVECKSSSSDTGDWVTRIDELKTSDKGIVRMAEKIASIESQKKIDRAAQTETRPLKILCGLGSESKHKDVRKNFDFVILAHKEQEGCGNCKIEHKKAKIEIIASKGDWSLNMWHQYLNLGGCGEGEKIQAEKEKMKIASEDSLEKFNLNEHYTVNNDSGNEVSLLTFNFQLNQLLMIINNPLLFPHQAYVKMFNQDDGKGGAKNGI